ncbi:hypothetical protein RB614_03555 [Phytohabitans sp. ZYX-F-186]|uniref:Glycosyltransferase RgtA/B/C/D-like domain-containing protein n=1 Tax=Phytohabitans maris TaxID=3071409 RepID=A0ABU0Z963_9ACTN|nr:hypothetical protein [Phytohabitans sp. ZYX-F-186]MDQ7903589.1 hypothetical protein [Phytohabitans sp. ZYX-F-186]
MAAAAWPVAGPAGGVMAGRRFDLGAVALAGVLAVLVPTLTMLDAAVPGRALAAVAFVVAVPGVPLAYALRLPHRLVTVVLALCLSVAAALLGGAVAALLGRWDPFTAVTVTAAVGLVATPFAVAAIQSTPVPPPDPAPAAPRAARIWGLGAVALALCLWWVATRQVDAGAAGAVGLVAVAPPAYWLALLVLAGVLAWALLRPVLDHVVLAAACAAAAVCCYLLVNVADGAAGPGTTWVHVGFVDFVSRTGELATGADARFSWPGFLAGTAQLVATAGLADAAPLALPAPAFFAALALPALWLVGRLLTGSPRVAWLGAVLYLAFNWYQQDYLSAQAVGFVLYTGVLAVLLWAFMAADVPPLPGPRWRAWLRAPRRVPGRPRAGPGAGEPGPEGRAVSGATVVGLEAALTLVIAALVVSHQLTPVALVAALLCFTLTGATRLRTLWVAAAAMFVGWFSYGATGFWTGHIEDLFGDLGRVRGNVSTGVGERLVGDPLYQQMQYSRIGWTGLLCLAAAAGWLIVRRRRGAVLAAGLAAAPAVLMAVQSYGGEVVIRCALYASPVLAPLAAVAVSTVGSALTRAPWRLRPALRFAAAATLVAAALATLTATRGLNASFEHVTAGQVERARAVLAAAPDGGRVGTVEAVGPLPLARFGQVSAVAMPPPGCPGEVADCLLEQVGADGSAGPEYVYVTGTQEKSGQLRSGLPAGWTDRIVDTLLRTGGYRVVVRSAEVTVLERVPAPGRGAEGGS